MLTDYYPFETIPREWFKNYNFLYPSLRYNGLQGRKLEAEKRLMTYLENVSEDGRHARREPPMAPPRPHNQPFLSREIRERILPELYRNGMSQKALAQRFQVSQNLVCRLLHRLQEPTRRHGPRPGYKQTPEHIAKRMHSGKREEVA